MPDSDCTPDRLIADKYRLVRTIGAGGMGTVYEVVHEQLDKRFALKTLQRKFLSQPALVKRFGNEAKIHAKLDGHKNIAAIIDFGITSEGLPFYVMELLDQGKSLREILRHVGRLEMRRALEVAVDVFEALAHAHRKGIIHRDIKPDNIFIHTQGPFWFVKIVDFGISRILDAPAGTGERYLGTITYSAREHLQGRTPTFKMDVYAATLVLFVMLTGRSAFADLGKEKELIRALVSDHPPRAPVLTKFGDFPLQLASLVSRGLSHDPEERPDALYMASQLHSLTKELEGQVPIDINATIEDLSTTVHTLVGEEGSAALSTSRRAPELALATTTPVDDGQKNFAHRIAQTVPEGSPRDEERTDVSGFVPSHEAPLATASDPPRSWEPPKTPLPVDREAPTRIPLVKVVAPPAPLREPFPERANAATTSFENRADARSARHSAAPPSRGKRTVMGGLAIGAALGLAVTVRYSFFVHPPTQPIGGPPEASANASTPPVPPIPTATRSAETPNVLAAPPAVMPTGSVTKAAASGRATPARRAPALPPAPAVSSMPPPVPSARILPVSGL